MDTAAQFAIVAGLGWASGLRFYAVLFFAGALQHLGLVTLPPDLEIVAHPAVMVVAGTMFAVEFCADKIPGFDSVWDAFQTFVRIPGGALLAAAAVADQSQAYALAAAILGGTLAAGAHFAKAGGRALINASPEPFSNWTASLAEDALAAGVVWFAFRYPLASLVVTAGLAVLTFWVLRRVWRGVRFAVAAARRLLGETG